MGLIQDLLQEVPLAAVLRERIALADQKYEAAIKQIEELKDRVAVLERENAALRAQIPHRREEVSLGEDSARVLVQIFKARNNEDRDVGTMANALHMERGVLQYHLDRLNEAGLALMTGGNYVDGHTYWGLQPKGRQYVVERKLVG
jgi:hypothetical protein